jgi:surface protein
MVFVKNKGDYDAYVRSIFAFEAGNYETLEEFQKMVHLNLNEKDYTWEWTETPVTIGGSTYFVATATYNNVLAPGALTEISLSQIALDKTATNADVEAFGDTYQVLVKSQGIQADGFTDPDTALNEGFGVINDKNIPWETDAPTKGGTIYNALRYLNADVTAEDLTTKVGTITFGLNKDHADIIAKSKGTLVDVEQDVPVYAYYVNKGTTYDVYLLADDDIYLPKDSTGLMMDMTALTAVYTENLNTSRTESMRALFRKCAKLTTVDTNDWDTSKVTDMHQVFYQCSALQSIPGIEDWDTGASTTMRGMFRQCGVKGDLDLSGWDISNVTEMYQMFYMAPNLVNLNTEGWDMESVERTELMFYGCPVLKGIIGSKDWYMPKNTTMKGMFQNCVALESVDVHNWEIPNVTSTWDMFCGCTALITVPGIGNWDFGSVDYAISMFNGCTNLQYLDDLSGWDMRKVYDFGFMFYKCKKLQALEGIGAWKFENLEKAMCLFMDCKSLTELDIANWNMSKVQTFNHMFASDDQNKGDMKFKKLDLSKWDTSSATNMGSMFYGCGQLTELDLSDWNMPNLTTVTHMFADCYKLEKIDVSGWQTPSLVCMDAMFNHCTSLQTIDMSSFDTSNVKEFSQMFEVCQSLTKINGLEKWDTSNGMTFAEMFSSCSSLTELDLSNFNTRNANENGFYMAAPRDDYECFESMFSGMTALTKLTVGENFTYDEAKVTKNNYKPRFPALASKEGFIAKWRNADNKTDVYAPGSLMPLGVAATYEAYYEAIPTT